MNTQEKRPKKEKVSEVSIEKSVVAVEKSEDNGDDDNKSDEVEPVTKEDS